MCLKYKFAYVLWVDAFSYEDVHPTSYQFTSHPLISSGFVVEDNDEDIVVCRDYFPEGSDGSNPLVRGTIAIPKRCVKEIIYDEKEFEGL